MYLLLRKLILEFSLDGLQGQLFLVHGDGKTNRMFRATLCDDHNRTGGVVDTTEQTLGHTRNTNHAASYAVWKRDGDGDGDGQGDGSHANTTFDIDQGEVGDGGKSLDNRFSTMHEVCGLDATAFMAAVKGASNRDGDTAIKNRCHSFRMQNLYTAPSPSPLQCYKFAIVVIREP